MLNVNSWPSVEEARSHWAAVQRFGWLDDVPVMLLEHWMFSKDISTTPYLAPPSIGMPGFIVDRALAGTRIARSIRIDGADMKPNIL